MEINLYLVGAPLVDAYKCANHNVKVILKSDELIITFDLKLKTCYTSKSENW